MAPDLGEHRFHGTGTRDGGVVGEAGRSGEAEAFARLMRGLKERAGLSYGTLARRLHTSTSTLHRYCNGDAVPAEFAAVDRFARACGATRDEALGLHRAWLLADARRRAVAGTPIAERQPEPEPEPEQEPGPVVGAGAEPDAGVDPDAATRQASQEREAGDGLAEGPVVEVAPGPVPVVRRRRAFAVAAAGVAVAAAAAVTVAMVVRGPDGLATGAAGIGGPAGLASAGPTGSAGGSPSGPGATSPGPDGASAEASPSGAGSPTGTPSDPAPGGSAAGSAGSAGSAPADPPAATSPPAQGAAPLKAAVRSHVWAGACDHRYLSERAPTAVPAPPVEADAPAWARAQGAVHAGSQIVEATVHGTGEGAVVLEGMEVRVTARRSPPAWNVYGMSQGCGGALTPATFAVNLDAPRPLARPVAGNDSGEALPAPSFPMRVSAAEPVVLRVEAATTGCDCDWSLDLRWSSPGGSGTLRLDDGGGRSWRVAPTAGRPLYGFAGELGRWAR
ncbi:helix-turn-helix domain-containing protein [Streptomyces sp. NPDC048606]|uniref:transcriptional regulator n=1 Tax=Streptomyces sp. NPDC048606 TaxID=3154726 RepID=UPI00343E9201